MPVNEPARWKQQCFHRPLHGSEEVKTASFKARREKKKEEEKPSETLTKKKKSQGRQTRERSCRRGEHVVNWRTSSLGRWDHTGSTCLEEVLSSFLHPLLAPYQRHRRGSRCWQVMTCIRTSARRVQTTKTDRRGGEGACGWRGGGVGCEEGECLVTGTTDVTAIHRRTEPCYLALVDKSMHPQYPSTGRSHLTAGLPSLVPFHPATWPTASRSLLSQTEPLRSLHLHDLRSRVPNLLFEILILVINFINAIGNCWKCEERLKKDFQIRFSNFLFLFSIIIFDDFSGQLDERNFGYFARLLIFLTNERNEKVRGGIIVNLRGAELEKRIFEIKEITVSRTLGRGEELYYYAQFGFDLAKEYLSRGFHWKNLSFPPSTENFLPLERIPV